MSGMNTVNQSTFEQSDVAMHEGGGMTADSGEPVRLLYTNLQDPSGLADLLLDERVDIRLVRGTCLKALDRKKQTFIRRQEVGKQSQLPGRLRHARRVTEVEARQKISRQGSDHWRLSRVGNQRTS